VSNIEVNSRVEGDWVPLNEATVYSVVTNNYIAAGRDGYEVFADVDWVDTTQVYTFPLIQYVEAATANGEAITKLPLSEYSTKSYIDSAGCDHSTTAGCPVPEA
jgi:5'-nucleotidase